METRHCISQHLAAPFHHQHASRKDTLIDSRNSIGASPLHWACKFGQRQSIAALVAAGADCHVKDADGRTPADVSDAPQTASAALREGIPLSYRYFVPGMAVLVDRDAADRSHQKYISPKGLWRKQKQRMRSWSWGRSNHVHQTPEQQQHSNKLPEQCTVNGTVQAWEQITSLFAALSRRSWSRME